ncbi:MAG: hypothetical protein Q8K96_16305 [Rubrivivax sp.]|nr:hypothetical protein [Rubrivivax sp.]
MPQHALPRNPFMLMLNPEVVLAAIEKSERLGKLNRHLCRPLDRAAGAPAMPDDADSSDGRDTDGIGEISLST